jgi:hypothetical protein
VFCQNCGVRLARPKDEAAEDVPTLAAGVKGKGKVVRAPKSADKSGPKKRLEGGSLLGLVLWRVLTTAALAAVLAALIQFLRPPDGVPPVRTVDVQVAKDLFSRMAAAAGGSQPASIEVTQDQLNDVIAQQLIGWNVDSGLTNLHGRFSRCFVVISRGKFDFVAEEVFLGRAVYFSIFPELNPAPDGTGGVVEGWAIGRLPVHPDLRMFAMVVFDPVFEQLPDLLSILRRCTEVQLNDRSATLTWNTKPLSELPSR